MVLNKLHLADYLDLQHRRPNLNKVLDCLGALDRKIRLRMQAEDFLVQAQRSRVKVAGYLAV
jgi:hypothetical protein